MYQVFLSLPFPHTCVFVRVCMYVCVCMCMCVCVCAGEDDLVDITDYLMELDKSQIFSLGLVLGLARRRVNDFGENCGSNVNFLDAVVLHWLQRVDRVGEVSWSALVTALRHPRLGQTGIANKIATQHGKGVETVSFI